ncbi:MAG TPA: hypothetical protein PKC20_06535, partial [Burkholderiaceae bacterium]|nr:hypothetical protein [Burkholderiaceae bacterium]
DSNNRSIFDLNVQPAAAAGVAARPTTVKIGRARVQVIQLAFSTDLNAAPLTLGELPAPRFVQDIRPSTPASSN